MKYGRANNRTVPQWRHSRSARDAIEYSLGHPRRVSASLIRAAIDIRETLIRCQHDIFYMGARCAGLILISTLYISFAISRHNCAALVFLSNRYSFFLFTLADIIGYLHQPIIAYPSFAVIHHPFPSPYKSIHNRPMSVSTKIPSLFLHSPGVCSLCQPF